MPVIPSAGIDIGHSAVKLAITRPDAASRSPVLELFPSIAIPAFAISDEAEARRAARETVTVRGRQYFFGDTARAQGGGVTGLSEDWIESPEHEALLRGAFRVLERHGTLTDASMIAVGLPASLFGRQKERMRALAAQVFPGDIKVIPQPFAPYQGLMLDESGLPQHGRTITEESWAVVEVGYFTTDFMLAQRGRWVEKAAGSCSGVRVAAEQLARLLSQRGITADLPECEEALRSRSILDFGRRVDVGADVDQAGSLIVTEVVETATRLMEPFARKLNGVVIAGGGASLVFKSIQDKWPHAVMAMNTRFAVAEGMRRLGLSIQRAMQMASA